MLRGFPLLVLLGVLGLDLPRACADFVSMTPAPQSVAADDALCGLLGLDSMALPTEAATGTPAEDQPDAPPSRHADFHRSDDATSSTSTSPVSSGGPQAALHIIGAWLTDTNGQAYRQRAEPALSILMRFPLFRPPCA